MKRLKAMGMIQKQGSCIPYELKLRDVERLFFACEQLLQRQNLKGIYIALWPATKSGPTTIIPSAENHGEYLDMTPRRRPGRIFTVPRLCSAFGGISSVWCIMSCCNRVKLSQGDGVEGDWCLWTKHWRRKGHSTKRDTIKLSSSMTMLDHMSQDTPRHTWKRWNGRSYHTRRTFHKLLLPNTICFDRWDTAWLISISALMKKSKNGSIRGSP